jgi:hypothetical protein
MRIVMETIILWAANFGLGGATMGLMKELMLEGTGTGGYRRGTCSLGF